MSISPAATGGISRADGTEIHVLTFGRRVAFKAATAIWSRWSTSPSAARPKRGSHTWRTMTGSPNLPNREFLQRAPARGAGAQRGRATSASRCMCLDLDLFKNVNDSLRPSDGRFGCCKQVGGTACATGVRDDNVAARLGGDEFAIVLAADVSPNEASAFAERLIDALSAPYNIDGLEVVVGASVGIALSPGDGTTSGRVDEATRTWRCTAPSPRAAARISFFEPEMDEQAQKRRDMERDLRAAFTNGEFELHYQPLVDIAADRISGFESLLRWRHPQQGWSRPRNSSRWPEDIGLIVALGEWVLREACAEAMKWPRRREGCGQPVADAVPQPQSGAGRDLRRWRIPACRRGGSNFEITEIGVPRGDRGQPGDRSISCANSACSISMDDFGTGYSSLSYLRSFPFDKIKIDRSFVQGSGATPDCLAIVRAISGLGRSLKITTTAEGVETTDQLDWLRAEGCTEVQGFLFSAREAGTRSPHCWPALPSARRRRRDALALLMAGLDPAIHRSPKRRV